MNLENRLKQLERKFFLPENEIYIYCESSEGVLLIVSTAKAKGEFRNGKDFLAWAKQNNLSEEKINDVLRKTKWIL